MRCCAGVSEDGARERADQDAARMNTPDWLWDSWTEAWGEDKARAIAAMHLAEAPTDLTMKEDAGDLADSLPAQQLAPHSLRTTRSGAVTGWPGFEDGNWWVQDLAASLPARLIGDVPGQKVIDLCAAPGGKTLQLAAARGEVTALDISGARLGRVQENLGRTGLDAELIEGDALTWRPEAPAPFVLLDAPCSATGTCRRHPDLPHLRTLDQITELVALQVKLLDAAADMVAAGGLLLYATCSLQPEEGEHQAKAFLERHANWQLDPIQPEELMGLPLMVTDGMLRTLPCDLLDQGGMDGFFIARFRKGHESV